MTGGLETALSHFLFGLSQKCIVAAVKKWKENRDASKADSEKKAIHDFEAAKSIATKVQQRITKSIGSLAFSSEQLQRLVDLETNPLIKDEVVASYLNLDVTAEQLADCLINDDATLLAVRDQLVKLANIWLEEIDKAVSEDPILSNALTLKAHRKAHSSLKGLEENLVKSELRSELRDAGINRKLDQIISAMGKGQADSMLLTKDRDDNVPDAVKSIFQRRFDKAKESLKVGKIIVAEDKFRELLEEISQSAPQTETELVMRCHLNIATCLWEQNKMEAAVVEFEKAYALMPDDWRAKRGRGFSLVHAGKVNEALEILREIRLARPDEYEHVCNEAWLLKNNGRANEAIQILEARIFEDEHYYSILSYSFSRVGRFADAEKAARRALDLAPDSDLALMALSNAIAFPIVNRRIHRETFDFSVSNEEWGRLKEAVDCGEKAATKLRVGGRFNSLIDTLLNLTAYYLALDDCKRAIELAEEALRYDSNNVMVLRNLWCGQMRDGQFERAATSAEKLARLDNPEHWTNRRLESLVLADRGQDVIEFWETSKSDPQTLKNAETISIVSNALAKRHRTDEAIQLLTDALFGHPSSPRLLNARGLLYESLDKMHEAAVDLAASESDAKDEYHPQAVLDYGRFLQRRGEWRKASERFKLLGAESVHNPLFSNHLACLFNLGEYRHCIKLAEEAIKAKGFVEENYAIAARCYHICNELPRAKKLLDILVAKTTHRELEHRKILAWVYWRMDDLPQAYDVLIKCLKLDCKDIDSLILASAVCSILKKYPEAIEYAYSATLLEPESVRAHSALISTVFSCPKDYQIKAEHRDAHFQSLTFLQKEDSGVIRAIPIEPDFHTIFEMIKNRSMELKKFEDFFNARALPMGIFAKRYGRSVLQTWVALMRHQRLKLRMSFGTVDEQQKEVETVRGAKSVSIDIFAFLTLSHLRLLPLLPKMFEHVFVHGTQLEEIVNEIREVQQHPDAFSLSYDEGKFIRQERTPEQNAESIGFLNELKNFLKSGSVELIGLLPESTKGEDLDILIDTCGETSIAPWLVARERGAVLYSDDACIKAIGQIGGQTPGFCTQALLRVAVERGYLTPVEYQDAVIRLLKSNYVFVSEDAGTLVRCYEKNAGKINEFALSMVNRVNDRHSDPRTCLNLLADFAVFVWRSTRPGGADSRESWLREIWTAISKAKDPDSLMLEFIARLAVACQTQPAVFFGIINFGISKNPFVNSIRNDVFTITKEAVRSMARVVLQLYPFWKDLSKSWVAHQNVFNTLARQGFIDNHVLPMPPLSGANEIAKRPRKHQNKSKKRKRTK